MTRPGVRCGADLKATQKRFQLRRSKGCRMPANTVKVDRLRQPVLGRTTRPFELGSHVPVVAEVEVAGWRLSGLGDGDAHDEAANGSRALADPEREEPRLLLPTARAREARRLPRLRAAGTGQQQRLQVIQIDFNLNGHAKGSSRE